MDEFWIFDGMGTPPGWEFFNGGMLPLVLHKAVECMKGVML